MNDHILNDDYTHLVRVESVYSDMDSECTSIILDRYDDNCSNSNSDYDSDSDSDSDESSYDSDSSNSDDYDSDSSDSDDYDSSDSSDSSDSNIERKTDNSSSISISNSKYKSNEIPALCYSDSEYDPEYDSGYESIMNSNSESWSTTSDTTSTLETDSDSDSNSSMESDSESGSNWSTTSGSDMESDTESESDELFGTGRTMKKMANELIDGVLDIILEYEEYLCRNDDDTIGETIVSVSVIDSDDSSDDSECSTYYSDDSISTFNESDFEEDHYHDNEYDHRFCAQCRYLEQQRKFCEKMVKCEFYNVI
jgi:clumping factor B